MATPPRSAARLVLEPAEQPADRGAGAGDDDGSGHGCLLQSAGPAGDSPGDDTHACDAQARPRRPCRMRKTSQGVAPCAAAPQHDGRMTPVAAPAPRSPRSTTSGSPCPTSTRRSPSTATPSACELVHEETNEEQGVREAMVGRRRLRRSCIQLLAPLAPDSHDREVPRPLRPRPAAARLPGRPTSTAVSATRCARTACACCTTSPAAARPAAGSTSSTPRTPAACWSSSSSRPPRGG